MTGREHDPQRGLLRCTRDDLRALAAGGDAPGLPLSQLLATVATTVTAPAARFAVLGSRADGATVDGAVGPQLVVWHPAAAPDTVVDVRYAAVATLARVLHRCLGPLPTTVTEPDAGPTTYGSWGEAVASLAGERVVQLRWADGADVPGDAALVVAVGDDTIRRVTPADDGVRAASARPGDLWRACCVLADRALRAGQASSTAR